jgi:uncharacterized membrane protein YeiH
MHDPIVFFDLLGVVFFAIAGALSAGRKRMDLFGVVVVGCVTAIGGGTLRDVLLGSYPVFWIAAPHYFIIAALAAAGTFFMARRRQPPVRLMMYADAGGLALFTLIGFQKGLLITQSYSIGIIMGVMTGVAGGIIRDVLCDEIPLIFRREIYASSSLFGAILLAISSRLFGNHVVAVSISLLSILVIRLAAIRWKLSMPVFVLDQEAGQGDE